MVEHLLELAPPSLLERSRAAIHALVLAAVAALVLASVFAAPRAASAGSSVGRGGPAGDPEPPAPDWMLLAPVPEPLTVAALPSANAPLAQSVVRATPSPTAVPRPKTLLPEWLQSTQETGLWSGPDDRAVYFTTLPGRSYLKPLGPYLGGRLLVYYAGDGDARAAGQAWIDAQALEPSGPPPWIASAGGSGLAMQTLQSGPHRVRQAAPPRVTAGQVAIVDDVTGQLLYAEKANQHVPPASTTKILTTTLALEQSPDLARTVPVTVSASEMVARDGSSVMGLEPGEQVSLETLLYGMMLPSGNDAAEQTALTIGGTRERFVDLMNQKVAWLGLKDTHFANPSGMDDPNHYSSAYDMAMLARYAMRNETFRKLAGAAYYYGDGYNLKNLNRLIGWYAGADGVKVGYTDIARKTFVASASRDGHRVFVSLMHSEDLVTDSQALFDWVWQSFNW